VKYQDWQLMSKEEKLVPELRFPEFENDGEWEIKPISKVFTSFSGGTPNTSEKDFYGGGIPFIRSAEINKDKTELFLTESGLANSAAKLVNKGDLLVALYGANSGDVAISKIDGAINQAILCLKSEYSNLFTSHFLSLKKDSITSKYIQGGQGNLSGDIVKSIEVLFPKKDEQKKIASCLSSLDELLAAHLDKLETLKDHKKGLMQNLFPGDGEIVPKHRFSEFENKGAWQKVAIGYITQVTSGGTPESINPNYWKGDIPWMNSGELNNKRIFSVSNFITREGLENSSTKLIPPECVLIGLAGQGKTRGTAAINYFQLCTNQSIAAIHPNKKKFVSEFLYQVVDSMYEKLRSLSTGDGGRGGLNLAIIKSIELLLPTLGEQKKIASCLYALDELITTQTDKIKQLQLHKKGLMQGLFPKVNG